MTTKPRRNHDAKAAMLAYRTGARSAAAIEAALMAESGDPAILAARSEIEAFALARLKANGRHPVDQIVLLTSPL